MANSSKLKFPILRNVEYFDVVKNKQTIKTFLKKDLENSSWRDLQLKLGREFSAGAYHYALKFNNDETVHRGLIRVVSSIPIVQKNDSKQNENILNEIENIKAKIQQAAQPAGVSYELLISITKQSYETQISFLNNELTKKENFINKQQVEIDKLNDELDNAAELIDELKQQTGVNQYIELGKMFLQSKIGGAKKISSLKDSSPADIPEKIILILGAVDWSQVDDRLIDEIIKYLEIFITKLPLKGQ
jgi:hypothetical protein